MNFQTIHNRLLRLCSLLAVIAILPQLASAQTTVKYVHTDALGSVVAMTDATGVVIEGRREYEAYGQQLTPAVQDGPGFTGHVQDVATGLTYMQQRYYDPQIGRFLSVDPVTAYSDPVGMFNRYKYAANNPYRFTDPDGRQERAAERFGDSYASMNQGERDGLRAGLVGGLKGTGTALLELNSGGPGGGGKAAVAGALTKGSQATSALTRAKEIQGALKPATQNRVTTAVAETQEGVRVVGSSEGALRPAQRAALQEGEVAAKGARGTHAEVNAVNGARAQGLTPTSVSPSRPACTNCQEAMKKMDIPIKD